MMDWGLRKDNRGGTKDMGWEVTKYVGRKEKQTWLSG
jgi:hypothetical protein